ncbi:DUF2793 domain-containing protein [Pseudoroseicyclus tamaricis]|uniref:DUF2793 domain-containing protein n=1 Tax=Pseudoroseicyclus tamaricis TaxID=2705421 RepID=A0A6B2JM19_9RHOB|nr:DUF2793 domain-containing protein [Pseudoroseicyclus tamaricis]NDV02621.1 DUF2793 domain-containing protein [Pseudoroseicyclus tamaricis]
MTQTSPRLSLPYLQAAQAQKHVTHNEALQILDALVGLGVASFDAASPPASPEEGEVHALGSAPTGAWEGRAGQLALFANGGWLFVAPQEGWLAWDISAAAFRLFSAGAWAPWVAESQNLAGLGIGTTWNAGNRLSVASDAALFSHAGGGHQRKVNKAAAGETASLLFQSDWMGRAEMGLAGSNAFSIKVSPDGSAWHTGLTFTGTGIAALLAGTTIDGAEAYHRANILAPVGLAAGSPTGGVIERGSGAGGEWARFADGTQLCWTTDLSAPDIATTDGALHRSADISWTFPSAFSAPPAVTAGQTSHPGAWSTTSAVTATGATARLHAATSTAGPVTFALTALGRWD